MIAGPRCRVRRWLAAASLLAAAAAALLLAGVRWKEPYAVGPAGRHVFIDGGAHRGESIRSFKRTRMYRDHAWEIFALEANPEIARRFPAAPDVTVLNQAMWTNSGTIAFFLTDETTCSSLFKNAGRDKLPAKRRVDAECIDFNEWLLRRTRVEDCVILKMDIEGAEYPILDHLLRGGSVDRLDMLFIEFHGEWVGVPRERDMELLSRLRAAGVRVEFAQSERDGDWFAGRWSFFGR